LGNKRSENDRVSRRMWEVVETKAGKIRVAKAKKGRKEKIGRREERRKRKRKGRKEEEKIKRKQDNRCEESSGGMENLR